LTNPLPNMTRAFSARPWFASRSRTLIRTPVFLLFFCGFLFATSVIAGMGAGAGESKIEGGGKGMKSGDGVERKGLSVRPYSPSCAKSNFTLAQTLFCLYLEQTAA